MIWAVDVKNREPREPGEIIAEEPSLSFWMRLVRGPIFVTSLTSVFTFLGTVLLFRQLGEHEAGILTLMLAMIQFGVMLGGLGQPTLIQRLYSYSMGDEFDWMRDLVITNFIAFPLTLLLAFFARMVYGLTLKYSLLVFFLSILQLSILTESRMLNAVRNYSWASVLMRVPNSLLIIPGLLLSLFEIDQKLDLTLTLYTVVTLFISIFGLFILNRVRFRGHRIVSLSERRSGFVFLFTQSSYSLPEQGVVALGGGLLDPIRLATYGAVAPLLKPFDMLTDVLRNVLTTELIHLQLQQLRRLVAGLWTTGLIASLFTIAAGPILIDWLYSGRYTAGKALIPWLAVAGLFRLLEVFPRSHIIGQSVQRTLRRFVLWQSISAALLLSGGLALIQKNSVIGIAWTMAAIQLIRFLISELFYRRELQKPA